MHPWLETSKFEQRYIPEPNTGCWLWTAALSPSGYGSVWPEGRRVGTSWRAHRLAYVLFRGDIPEGMQVLHRCDTPSCVNPDHLFLGTPADNKRDERAKGRSAIGERHPRARLTAANVRSIRERYGRDSTASLAQEFGISKYHVWDVARGKAWASVLKPVLALLFVSLAASANAMVDTTYNRHSRGNVVSYSQVSCGTTSTTLRTTNVGVYDRLSITIKNCEASGGNNVYVCPGSATCTTATGFQLAPREGFWIDWSNNGVISCIATVGAVNVCNIDERD